MGSAQSGNAVIFIAVIAVVIGAALIGYSSMSSFSESEASETVTNEIPAVPAETDATHEHDHADHGEENPAVRPLDVAALQTQPTDIIIGDVNAPLRIVEYASLSCPHCARMHLEILPPIKASYVDSGKAYIAYRHFPLNAPALKAAVAVDCAPADKRTALLNNLFTQQKAWAFDSGYLENIAAIAADHGVSAEAWAACNADTDLENRLLESRQQGEAALGVQSTPTLFVAETRLDGAVDTATIEAAIAAALGESIAPVAEAAQEIGDNAKEMVKP